jgi:hypothetical protein
MDVGGQDPGDGGLQAFVPLDKGAVAIESEPFGTGQVRQGHIGSFI